MTTELANATTHQPAAPANPFARAHMPEHTNAGTVTIESERAIAEAQGKLIIAKRFPRDQARAFDRVMESCSRPSLASSAEYAFPRGGQTVRGPSIRLAEELARCWGNLDYGIRELSRKGGVSEMEAYCWDLETNTCSSQKFTVRHIRDTKGGGKALSDERDIYELTANQGGRRLRARILAILPPDLVDAAVERCRQTLAGNSAEPISDRVRKMITAFKGFGVTEAHLSTYLGKSLDKVLSDDLADLASVYNSIKTGTASASDFFNRRDDERAPRSFQSIGSQQPSVAPQSPEVGDPGQAAGHHPSTSADAASSPSNAASVTAPEQAPQEPDDNLDDGDSGVDARGIPWDERIHSSSRARTADGAWRRKRGVDPALVERIERELMDEGDLTTNPPSDEIGQAQTQDQPGAPPLTIDRILAGISAAEDSDTVDEWVDLSRDINPSVARGDQIRRAANERCAYLEARAART
ncbi:hypothetical protein [Marichromatium gracile]|uniref:Uncharacterized protein n=1 Tax=Marichromatium gracile TaxID=1048 RepID=A0A4R4A4G4_MARGR|nr:hypothetical protein [Marichromatium gracile]MBK1709833.1 hypothetical protein [Marichromatium gracile]TCW32653.1 hypothetical protein EDC29_11719 [Marichromatium gracile]